MIVVWRKNFAPQFRSLEQDERTLWNSIRDGATFSEACDALTAHLDADAAPQRAAGFLRRWVDDAWLERFELSG